MNTVQALTLSGEKIELPKEKFRLRVAGYGLIIWEDKILLLNTKSTGRWFYPGGEVELGESVEDALKREVKEEAGIDVEVNRFVDFREVFFYYEPTDDAFQNYALYFICAPKTFELTDAQNVADDESEKPTWVKIQTLKKEDFQEGIFDLLEHVR